ncbi:mitochondrial carrier domain-containing protein [Yarrowia lipolytica]|jgi:solute carrier family 25 iron transporter 28/37|uniref:YALI0B21604p n=2 Tax=Yarrowia lipolytica TaxID=4952 RepID=Q6CDS3_YARLI|nr:YALI0B21604p [Yarrowia lipolytica CLIB122]AOW02038.1 hypothetical protein YALI1_B28215g [Yarrowia lipolytica]KAB8283427.1 mitochondrial carrier domain-containing protein [Yarrowia lipolytica]KAE8173340.1 mitochondrial carrier domain-containing protein [Yarrowia lipolytica]KAJ8052805.1 mitochondrial carrier domain-containing protein [Yarrowia lipolytica]QNP96992.1 Mitochondrial RNA-splicing protein MRS3 [Yarrowia lipolytica]|eukprot:XP_501189.1 YALI0B21604p [Yarrowia lipolytica CLIB122]
MESEDHDYEALGENTGIGANMLAGAFAGIMEHTVMYPVDAIKTRMQVGPGGTGSVYKGIVQAVSSISAKEGASSLWRGISSVIVGAGPAHAVYFGVYEFTKKNMLLYQGHTEDSSDEHHPVITSLAGAAATTSSDALMNPFDVIKQRMQLPASAGGSAGATFAQTAKNIFKNEGFGAFYVSYPTTLAMNVPFTAINFTVYESASKILNPSRKYDPLGHCVAGGVAGAVAAAVTTPLDVVKTFLQTRRAMGSESLEVRSTKTFAGAVKIIYREDGLRGFFRGLRPRIVANMPSTAICWTSYEMAKFYLAPKAKTQEKF